jgi:hypothetical protein
MNQVVGLLGGSDECVDLVSRKMLPITRMVRVRDCMLSTFALGYDCTMSMYPKQLDIGPLDNFKCGMHWSFLYFLHRKVLTFMEMSLELAKSALLQANLQLNCLSAMRAIQFGPLFRHKVSLLDNIGSACDGAGESLCRNGGKERNRELHLDERLNSQRAALERLGLEHILYCEDFAATACHLAVTLL